MSPPILFLVGLFLAIAVLGVVVGARQLDAASSAQVRLAAARENLDGLLRQQLSEETGLRGYASTGLRFFLESDGPTAEPFDARATRLDAELMLAGIANARAQISDLRKAHERWTREVEIPLLNNPSRADSLQKQTLGKLLTDQMRADAAVIRRALQVADADVESALRRRINATVAVSVGTIGIFGIVSLVLALSRAGAMQALMHEQSMVAALQQTLRVKGVQLPRTSVGFAYTSATREALVGGDLIDTWRADADRGWFLIADASGKGIEAARHSAFVQYAVRTLTAELDDPALVLERFNRLFLDTFDDPSIFVVLFLGAFDARTGSLRYASAGHATTFIQRSTGIEQLLPTGPIIGMGRDESYSTRTIRLETGETVVLATDGLTESRDRDGEMLGDDGVVRLLARTGADPQAICDELVAEVERRSHGEVSDDLAILVLRILDADESATVASFSTLSS